MEQVKIIMGVVGAIAVIGSIVITILSDRSFGKDNTPKRPWYKTYAISMAVAVIWASAFIAVNNGWLVVAR